MATCITSEGVSKKHPRLGKQKLKGTIPTRIVEPVPVNFDWNEELRPSVYVSFVSNEGVRYEGFLDSTAKFVVLPGRSKEFSSIGEAFISGLKKGIEKFFEKTGEILSIVIWTIIATLAIKFIIGGQINLESIKTLKEMIPLF